MDDLRIQIFKEIKEERERQVDCFKQLLDLEEFDKQNSSNDWIAYIVAYTGRAARKVYRNDREHQYFRENIIKVAALCVAALEAYDKGYLEFK